MADADYNEGGPAPAPAPQQEISNPGDMGALAIITKAEIDSVVSTARAYPRQIGRAVQMIIDMATMDEETAEECTYMVPRGMGQSEVDKFKAATPAERLALKKIITGPSIRFAEIVAQSWGNCQIGTRTTFIDKKNGLVEAEGVFLDSQTNMRQVARVSRSIMTSGGKLYSADLIQQTCNAAASIARRNAILSSVPKNIWRLGYQRSRQVISGDMKTLAARRVDAVKAFAAFGLLPHQVFAALGVVAEEDIGADEFVEMKALYRQLKNGETTPEEILKVARQIEAEPDRPRKNPLKASTIDADREAASQVSRGAGSPQNAEPDRDQGSEQATEQVSEPAAPSDDSRSSVAGALPERQADAGPTEAASGHAETEGQSAPKRQRSQPSPTATKADAPRGPKIEAEYIAHVEAWSATLGTATALTEQWKSERALRRDCGVTTEEFDRLKAHVEARIREIKGGEKL